MFKPGDISKAECPNAYLAFNVAMIEWLAGLNMGPLLKVGTAYYAANSVLSLIGVALIYWANRKITQSQTQVKTNWAQYIMHVCALILLSVLVLLIYFEATIVESIATTTLEAGINCFLCYVVWSQAFSEKLSDFDCYIEKMPDGS